MVLGSNARFTICLILCLWIRDKASWSLIFLICKSIDNHTCWIGVLWGLKEGVCESYGTRQALDKLPGSRVVFFWLCCAAYRILDLPPTIAPMPPTVEVQSLNRWTTREFHRSLHQVLFKSYWNGGAHPSYLHNVTFHMKILHTCHSPLEVLRDDRFSLAM